VTVRGRGRQTLRLPAFVFGPRRGVLPAFSSFTGGGMYERQTGDRLYAIAGDEVVALD
jgi:metallophosphoesterase superfamily enzyme